MGHSAKSVPKGTGCCRRRRPCTSPRHLPTPLSDQALGRDLATLVARERATTADVVAHIAEFDARKLYLPAAYPSMFAYCVGELHLSEDAVSKRKGVRLSWQRSPRAGFT